MRVLRVDGRVWVGCDGRGARSRLLILSLRGVLIVCADGRRQADSVALGSHAKPCMHGRCHCCSGCSWHSPPAVAAHGGGGGGGGARGRVGTRAAAWPAGRLETSKAPSMGSARGQLVRTGES